MNVVETLVAAREVIADPEHWTKGVFARDAKGHSVHAWQEEAVCFCSIGALRKVSIDQTGNCKPGQYRVMDEAMGVLERCVGTRAESQRGSVSHYNDHAEVSHKDVLDLFDEAIELARKY